MDIIEAVNLRRSIRAFKNEQPVKKDIIEKILRTALYAPSATNSQPWEFTIISGKILDKIKNANLEMLRSGVGISTDYKWVPYPSGTIYRTRQVELAKQIFTIMGIPREEKNKRMLWLEQGVRYFDAPAVIILSMDKAITGQSTAWLDLGSMMQTLCLLSMGYGLGTCIQGVIYPSVVRRYARIPESKMITVSIAIGIPDLNHQVNRMDRARESLENITSWHGFDD